MGVAASKVEVKSERKEVGSKKDGNNPESPQVVSRRPFKRQKTAFSTKYSEAVHDQSRFNFDNLSQLTKKQVSKQLFQSQFKLLNESKVQFHQIQSKEYEPKQFQNGFIQIQKPESIKIKDNQEIQRDLFLKHCSILELNEQDGKDLNKIKKVYPRLAKKNKHDNQKLIQLNQAFLFLRIFYFRTQFGTSAVYQTDKPQVFQKHCDVLNLSETDATNINCLKNNFTSIITVHRLNKKKRIEISIAYEYLANRIFKVEKSEKETKLIDAVILCDKETLIQMFTEDKELVNFRQKGSDYPLLYLAVRSGHFEIVELILRMGCEKDFEGEKSTPLHCAAFYEHKQILGLLLSYGLPHNVKNAQGCFPIEEASNDEVRRMLENVKKDEVQDLILSLTNLGICQGCINIKDNNGNVMARKILLTNYFREYNDHVDAFHGTRFEVMESIARHGLRTPGTVVDGIEIKVAPGHIGEERLEIQEAQETWSNAIFLSPSYNYASSPTYAKDLITMNHITGENDQWAPLVLAKVAKIFYSCHQSTTDDHQMLPKEPFDLEYRVEDSEKVTVVALILIRRQYMRERENKNYLKTTELLLNSKQETQFMFNSRSLNQQKLTKVLGNLHDSHFDNLIIYLTKQNLFKSKFSVYHENGTMMGRKICLKSGIPDKSNYVDAFHVTDYSSLWMLKKHGFSHLLNEKKEIFISPTIFEYAQMNSLPKEKLTNTTNFEVEEWSVILQIKVNKNVFLQSNRSQQFISNWNELSNMKFRIKSELLQNLDLRLCVVGMIFVNIKSINSERKYAMIVNKMR